jgi:methylmalonyl-CoA/ethylmalonyl-CoA epimerase
MVFEKIERIAIGVKSLEKAKIFFSDLLGITFDETLSDEHLNIRAAYSAFGIELVESMATDSVIDKFVKTRGEGVFCVVIKVTDMKAAVEKMEKSGMRRVGDLNFGGLKEVAFHPKESYGIQIVLAEYSARHPATIAALENINK